jgi:hypothetical protein
MVAPGAITEQRESETIHIAFSGRFGFGIDQWAYLPFEVPAGVQRIRVTTSHDHFAVGGLIRNVLDLGVFGPAGHDSHTQSQAVGSPQTVVHARELSIPALIDGLRCGRSCIARSRAVAVEFTASSRDAAEVAGPGQTLRVPPETPVTVTAMITGAAGTNAALITAAGCAGRATVVEPARTMLRWELDAASARFARLELRDAQRRPLGAMVALTNPVWLA